MGKLTGAPTHRAIVTLKVKKIAKAQPRAFVDWAAKTLLAADPNETALRAQNMAMAAIADTVLREAKRRCPALCHYKLDGSVQLFLAGAPRTKKNHGRVVWARKQKRAVHVPSVPYERWCFAVVAQIANRVKLADRPYNCAAVFYRDADRGDAVGYYQGLADALEAAGVVSDDKLITQWDGSRLRVDRKNPRVELTLTPVED